MTLSVYEAACASRVPTLAQLSTAEIKLIAYVVAYAQASRQAHGGWMVMCIGVWAFAVLLKSQLSL